MSAPLSAKTGRLVRLWEDDLAVRSSPRTVEGYRTDVRVFLAWLAGRGLDIAELRTSDLEAYQGDLFARQKADGKLYATSVAANRLGTVKALFRFLHRHSYLLQDPAAALVLPRLPSRLRVVLTRAEVGRLLAAPDTRTPQGLRDRAILETLYATGIRASELASLLVEHVDTEERVLFVSRGKGMRDRRLPLTRAAAAAIEDYLARIVRELTERAGIAKPVTAHTFRHTVATHLLQRHADIRHIQVGPAGKTLSFATRDSRLSLVRVFFAFLVKRRMIFTSPAEGASLRREDRLPRRVLTERTPKGKGAR